MANEIQNAQDKQISIFISYSRKNLDEADSIAERMRNKGFITLRDTEDILPTESWKERLTALIEQADAVVFLLSPASAKSEICEWEVEYAVKLGKLIVPVVIEDVAGASIPTTLSRLNYIFATNRDRLENAVDSLTDALSGTYSWIREHTTYLGAGLAWQRSGRRELFLLKPPEAARASRWLASRPRELPEPSPIVKKLVSESLQAALNEATYVRLKIHAIETALTPVIQKTIE